MKKKMLKVRMTLDTVVSGGRDVKRKSWRVKRKIPLSAPTVGAVKRRLKRMTKLMGLFSLTALMLLTVGCGGAKYAEPEEIAVVSAIGFDHVQDSFLVTMQAVEDERNEIITAKGESISLALSALYASGSKRYELSHCALAVVGEGVEGENLGEIFALCESEGEISRAILLVSAKSAAELLAAEGASGYDIAASMRSHPDSAGMFSENRYYELRSAEMAADGASVIALPYFCTTRDGWTVEGIRLYLDRRELTLLDRAEGAIYLMTRGIFSAGRIEYDIDGERKTLSVEKCRTTVSEGGVTCRLTVDSLDVNPEVALGEAADRLYGRLSELCVPMSDVRRFGFEVNEA